MTEGAKFLADAASIGSVLGIRVGLPLRAVSAHTSIAFIEDPPLRQRGLLRRDYGLFELEFMEGAGDWLCSRAVIQVHRLSSHPELMEEFAAATGVVFERYTPWSTVAELVDPAFAGALEVEEVGGYERIRSRRYGAEFQVVASPSAARGAYPGVGDVWSLHLLSAP